jgi:hypothetical protein
MLPRLVRWISGTVFSGRHISTSVYIYRYIYRYIYSIYRAIYNGLQKAYISAKRRIYRYHVAEVGALDLGDRIFRQLVLVCPGRIEPEALA